MTESITTPNAATPGRIFGLAATFCVAMMLMNVLIEDATRKVHAINAPALGVALTLGQFLFSYMGGWVGGGKILPEQYTMDGVYKTYAPYALLAFLLFCGTGLTNIAVGYVQYPVAVVFKSSKLVPVMAVSAFMGNSRVYLVKDYVAAVLLVLGTVGFAWNPGKDDDTPWSMIAIGITLLVSAVTADALTSNVQQKMMQRDAVDPMTMMGRLNFVGFCGILAFQIVSGQAAHIVKGIQTQPEILMYISVVGITLSVGAWANTMLVNEAGAVFTICVATLRKAVTILLSYIIFPKPFKSIHLLSAAMLLAGILLSDLMGALQKSQAKEKGEDKEPEKASAKV